MTKVNLKTKVDRREVLEVLAKGGVLSLFAGAGFVAGKNRADHITLISEPALMIVLKDGSKISSGQGQVVNSTALHRACKKAGLKFRSYKDTSDLFQEEEWVRQMHKQAVNFGCPCIVVVDAFGVGKCYEIPQTISEALSLIGVAK